MPKIFISTSSFTRDLPELAAIEALGYEIVTNPLGRRLNEQEIKEFLCQDVTGLIAGVEPLSADVLNSAKNLRAIARCGIGMDSVDIKAAEKLNIKLSNTPDAPTRAVAELTIGLMLSVLRRIPAQDRSIRSGQWERPMGNLLGMQTLGILGLGRIGTEVAKLAGAFGARVIAYDPFVKNSEHAQIMPLGDVLKSSNILSLHMPAGGDNNQIINARTLADLPAGAVIINTSRGELIDEDALAKALESGHIAGVGLDVYASEPYTGALSQFPNAVLTTHTGSYASETRIIQERQAAKNLYEALLEIGK